jgi:putative zinc finger/helix-turn-helix YgiT family protein
MPNPRCPFCKKPNALRTWEGPLVVMGVEVLARGLRCSACGEAVIDAEQARRQEREVARLVVGRGIRTGSELKLIRKLAGLRANELAELLDVRPETVSRWERGEVEIPRAVAFALGEYYEHPRLTRQKLDAFAREPETAARGPGRA